MAKYNIGDRICGVSNTGNRVEGVVIHVSQYSVGCYYDLRTDAGDYVKVDEPRAALVKQEG